MDVSGFQSPTFACCANFQAWQRSFKNIISFVALAATCCATAAADASTTITWSFAAPAGALPTTESYTGQITAGAALPGNPSLTIAATGYESQKQGRKQALISAADLYGKTVNQTVNGLGLADSSLPYPLPGTDQPNKELFRYAATVKKIKTTYVGYVQFDLAALIELASQTSSVKTATLGVFISSISGPDVAKVWYGKNPGKAGTYLKTLKLSTGNSSTSTTFLLDNLNSTQHYLTIKPASGEFFVNAITLTMPASASAVATPPTAILVLTGSAAMGLMLLARRRR